MTMLRTLSCLLLLASCGGTTKSAVPLMDPAPECSAVADRMVEQMLTGKVPRPGRETVDGIKTIISTRCEADAWTASAKRCLVTMKNEADADRCAGLLTDEQQAALVRDERARSNSQEVPAAAPPPARSSDPCEGGE